jgi:hypothetical protein
MAQEAHEPATIPDQRGKPVASARRTMPGNAAFVHRLLDFFAERGWVGAPRFLGADELGREVLSYLDGHVAWETEQPPDVRSERSLTRVAGLQAEVQ